MNLQDKEKVKSIYQAKPFANSQAFHPNLGSLHFLEKSINPMLVYDEDLLNKWEHNFIVTYVQVNSFLIFFP